MELLNYLEPIYTATRLYSFLIFAGFACAGIVTAFAWGYVLGLAQGENDETP